MYWNKKRKNALGLVENLAVKTERNVERERECAHLPSDATRLSNERANHCEAHANRQRDLRVAIQSRDNFLNNFFNPNNNDFNFNT